MTAAENRLVLGVRQRGHDPRNEDGSILHTTESFVEIPNLAPGDHSFFVVIGDGTHSSIDSLIADKVTVKVG